MESLNIDSDALDTQRAECEAIQAMFADDVITFSNTYPISYSIKLRPTHEEVEDSSIWPPDEKMALKVTYPAKYPDESPIFDLVYSQTKMHLHRIQENALFDHINAAADAELGSPCILSCFYAARDFFDTMGLVQAGLSMLKDDCLACVLSYLATTKDDVDRVVFALPLFNGVYKTDIVWKVLCYCRWKAKWGFRRRWNIALDDFEQNVNQSNNTKDANNSHRHFFWFSRYNFEENDSTRRAITRDELCLGPFEQRRWFSHNDPLNVRSAQDVLPTGLNQPGLDCQFTLSGDFLGYSDMEVKYSFHRTNPTIVVLSSMGSSDSLNLLRTPNWGWQLNNNDFIMRQMDEVGDMFASCDLLWKDMTSNLVMEERPPGVNSRFNWREIPNDEELQFSLPWRNSWRAPLRRQN